jgi:hypothetical protein
VSALDATLFLSYGLLYVRPNWDFLVLQPLAEHGATWTMGQVGGFLALYYVVCGLHLIAFFQCQQHGRKTVITLK